VGSSGGLVVSALDFTLKSIHCDRLLRKIHFSFWGLSN